MTEPPGGSQVYHPIAWVDPVSGTDGATLQARQEQINDPEMPFKTLHQAILTLYRHLTLFNDGPLDLGTEGTVYALPGVYGPTDGLTGGVNGPSSSGDIPPIVLRDRVHVKGVGAGRCIIRGNGEDFTHTTAFWPTPPYGSNAVLREVLVDLSRANEAYNNPFTASQPPWYDPMDQAGRRSRCLMASRCREGTFRS